MNVNRMDVNRMNVNQMNVNQMNVNQMEDTIKVKCNLKIEVRDMFNNILYTIYKHNLTTQTGLNLLRDILGGVTSIPTHLAVGTDNTAPVSGDIALVAEIFRGTITRRVYMPNTLQIQYHLPSTAANGQTLREAGVFNAADTMFARVVYSGIDKTASISITYTWDISFSVL